MGEAHMKLIAQSDSIFCLPTPTGSDPWAKSIPDFYKLPPNQCPDVTPLSGAKGGYSLAVTIL